MLRFLILSLGGILCSLAAGFLALWYGLPRIAPELVVDRSPWLGPVLAAYHPDHEIDPLLERIQREWTSPAYWPALIQAARQTDDTDWRQSLYDMVGHGLISQPEHEPLPAGTRHFLRHFWSRLPTHDGEDTAMEAGLMEELHAYRRLDVETVLPWLIACQAEFDRRDLSHWHPEGYIHEFIWEDEQSTPRYLNQLRTMARSDNPKIVKIAQFCLLDQEQNCTPDFDREIFNLALRQMPRHTPQIMDTWAQIALGYMPPEDYRCRCEADDQLFCTFGCRQPTDEERSAFPVFLRHLRWIDSESVEMIIDHYIDHREFHDPLLDETRKWHARMHRYLREQLREQSDLADN